MSFTLQDFLVKLGWSVDEPSFKKFAGAVAHSSAVTAELGSTAIETMAAVETMVAKVASKYETLYYAAQRNRTSIQYLQATQFGFKQIGLSAEEASASIEGIGARLRTQPWLRSLFGGATTPQGIADKLGKSGLPYFLQTRFAEMIGMDEKTLFHLQQFGEIEAKARDEIIRKQKNAGLDPEKMAKDATEFGRAITSLEGSLEAFGDRIAADLMEPTRKTVVNLTQMVDWLARVNDETKGWVGTLGALGGTAGGLIIVEKLFRRILGLNTQTLLGKGGGGLVKGAGRLGLTGGLIGAGYEILSMIKENDPEKKKSLQDILGPLFYDLGLSKSPDISSDKPYEPPAKAPAATNKSVQEKLKYVVDQAMRAGFPRSSANGIASGLYAENTAMNPQSVNSIGMSGIGQWDTKRRGDFQRLYGKDIRGASFEEQVAFMLWELNNTEKGTGDALRRGGQSGRGAAQTFVHGFERPGDAGEASDMRRAGPLADQLDRDVGGDTGGSVTTNNINIRSDTKVTTQGGGSAFDNAKAYKDAHDAVIDGQVRNLQTVLR